MSACKHFGIGALQREVKLLSDAGIIRRTVRGKQVYYRAEFRKHLTLMLHRNSYQIHDKAITQRIYGKIDLI